jgi:hypothetical protein
MQPPCNPVCARAAQVHTLRGAGEALSDVALAGEFEGEDIPLYDFEVRKKKAGLLERLGLVSSEGGGGQQVGRGACMRVCSSWRAVCACVVCVRRRREPVASAQGPSIHTHIAPPLTHHRTGADGPPRQRAAEAEVGF